MVWNAVSVFVVVVGRCRGMNQSPWRGSPHHALRESVLTSINVEG
jgi:hypothetical protein